MPPHLYDASFAYDHLIENSLILEFHRDNLISNTCLFRALQMFCTPTRNGYQPFHRNPPTLESNRAGTASYDTAKVLSTVAGTKNKRTYFKDGSMRLLGFLIPQFSLADSGFLLGNWPLRVSTTKAHLANFEYLGGREPPLPSNRGWSRETSPAPTVASAKLPASTARGNS